MIRDIVRQSWAQSPARVITAIALTPVAVYLVWAAFVVFIVALGR